MHEAEGAAEGLRGKHVVFLSWRDTRHPEGGGAEKYLEMIATGLVGLGAKVTVFTAAHPAAPPDETVAGIRRTPFEVVP